MSTRNGTQARVLIDGQWRESLGGESFQAVNPATGEQLPEHFPISPWAEIEQAIEAAHRIATGKPVDPESIADFLERYALQLEARAEELVASAHEETALPIAPRLRDGELPRTINQLNQAAEAARNGSWVQATIDTAANIRSQFEPIGPVVVIGPNNFPFAFNAVSGGDFAAAIAAGNPVIAKAHPLHPRTSRLLAEAAHDALSEAGLPPGFVQLIYHTSRTDGLSLVSDPRVGAVAFTGSRPAGLALKEAADRVGKPIYVELSSINPVVILPGALMERSQQIAEELTASCLMGAGQFCTNPGLVILPAGPEADAFIADVAERFAAAPVGTMLSAQVKSDFLKGVHSLTQAGAELVRGGEELEESRAAVSNTLLQTTGRQFLENPAAFQTECFGNSTLMVLANGVEEIQRILSHLEGNLTGCIYSDTQGGDDPLYRMIAPPLAAKVGRLLNDKMPTGVAVSPAMQHGGPFPASGHPGFTSVGIPAAIHRFARLVCYDNIRPRRLPAALQNENPQGRWRWVDQRWTRDSIPE